MLLADFPLTSKLYYAKEMHGGLNMFQDIAHGCLC